MHTHTHMPWYLTKLMPIPGHTLSFFFNVLHVAIVFEVKHYEILGMGQGASVHVTTLPHN